MSTRDILNYQGNKIGELELPDDTTEEQWEEALAPYAVAPASEEEQIIALVERTVSESRIIADSIIERIKRDNLLEFAQSGATQAQAIKISIWVHHRLRAITITYDSTSFTIDLMNLIISGDLETAYAVLKLMTPDDMTEDYHYFSQSKIDYIAGLISERIGIH